MPGKGSSGSRGCERPPSRTKVRRGLPRTAGAERRAHALVGPGGPFVSASRRGPAGIKMYRIGADGSLPPRQRTPSGRVLRGFGPWLRADRPVDCGGLQRPRYPGEWNGKGASWMAIDRRYRRDIGVRVRHRVRALATLSGGLWERFLQWTDGPAACLRLPSPPRR